MSRKTFTGPGLQASGPYSQAVDAGDFIYFSGQTAYNKEGVRGLAGQIKEQTELAFENLWQVLEATGYSEEDVVKVNVYLTSMDHFAAMNEVYAQRFSAPYPARTCVAVKELPLGADVEIEMILKK